jgi:hypothetical protein
MFEDWNKYAGWAGLRTVILNGFMHIGHLIPKPEELA